MKRAVIYIFFILSIPAVSLGSINQDPSSVLLMPGSHTREGYRIETGQQWQVRRCDTANLDLSLVMVEREERNRSLSEINGGIPHPGKPSPRDMVSMMSFVWAEIFGGVDIVAEVRDFARQLNLRNNPMKNSTSGKGDLSSRWRLVLAYRLHGQTEVAALFRNHGRLFQGGDMALEINTVDPLSGDVGLKMAFSGGDLDIRADRMTLTEMAAARLLVKF